MVTLHLCKLHHGRCLRITSVYNMWLASQMMTFRPWSTFYLRFLAQILIQSSNMLDLVG